MLWDRGDATAPEGSRKTANRWPCRRLFAFVSIGVTLAINPAHSAQIGGVTVSSAPPAAGSAQPLPPIYPGNPVPVPPLRYAPSLGCPQDKLLTDKSPCNSGASEAIPPYPPQERLPRCEQDRLLTDTRPCRKL